MKIADVIDQLLYTHPVHPHTKKVFEILIQLEEQYLKKIEELESQLPKEEPKEEEAVVNRDAEPPEEFKSKSEGSHSVYRQNIGADPSDYVHVGFLAQPSENSNES